MNKPLAVTLAIIALLVSAVVAFAWGRFGNEPVTYHGTFLEPAGPQADFTLIGPDEQQVHLSDYRDKIVVMYFGYTNCPDFCPGTLSKLARVREKLGDRANDVQVMMISVDPERDTPERLKTYMTQFDESFIGLTGDEETLTQVAADFGIFYQIAEEEDTASGYLVDHTTTVVVLDREGRQRLFWNWDLTVEEIFSDLENML